MDLEHRRLISFKYCTQCFKLLNCFVVILHKKDIEADQTFSYAGRRVDELIRASICIDGWMGRGINAPKYRLTDGRMDGRMYRRTNE